MRLMVPFPELDGPSMVAMGTLGVIGRDVSKLAMR
jgi:hypothetical protein